MRVGDVYGGDYLKADDLMPQGQPQKWQLTISRTRVHAFQDQKDNTTKNKIIVGFQETDKELVCNLTNANQIVANTGQSDSDNWIGHKVTLFPTQVTFGRDLVWAIRVEPGMPAQVQVQQQTAPAPAPAAPEAAAPAPVATPQVAPQADPDEIPF